jgi:hypothetical protein
LSAAGRVTRATRRRGRANPRPPGRRRRTPTAAGGATSTEAKECKAKGDWCEKHDRAKSQCFICDPSLKEKFAAKYRAKYDKEPPPIEEETEKKDEKPGEKK